MGGIVFDWINGRLKDGIDQVITILQTILMRKPPSGNSAFETVLYGLSWGYGEKIAIWVAVFLVFAAMLYRGYIVNLAHAVVIVVLLSSFGFLLFWIVDIMAKAEAWLASKALFYDEAGENDRLFTVPDIGNVLFSVLGLGLVLIAAGIVMVIYITLTIASIGAIAAILPTTGLLALGDRPKKFWNMLFALLIVARLLGRPAAIFCLEIGQWVRDVIPFGLGDVSLVACMITLGSLILIPYVLKMIAKAAYHAPGRIKSKIEGRSKVDGDVTAKLKDGQKVAPSQARQEYDRTSPMPVVVIPDTRPGGNPRREFMVAAVSTAAKAYVTAQYPGAAKVAVPVIDAAEKSVNSRGSNQKKG